MERLIFLARSLSRRPRRLLRDRRGASSIEYGLILAFVVLAMFGALSQTAAVTRDLWSTISDRFVNAR